MNIDIDISNVTLHTERLVLRPWQESDLEDLYEYASVDGVGQMAGWSPHGSIDTSRIIIKGFIEGKHTFALQLDNKVMGSLGIDKYDEAQFPELAEKKCREIGYVLSKDYWGKGIMAEAVKEVLRYLFEECDLEVALCGHFLSNHRSARVQEKCGFHHYSFGTYETRYGLVVDDEITILTKAEWLALRQK